MNDAALFASATAEDSVPDEPPRRRLFRALGRRLLELAVLLIGVTTLLFFLLRLSGDPALVLAGETADQQQIALVRAVYGLDRPLVQQYAVFMAKLATLDFGRSIASDLPAIDLVLERLGQTLLLAFLAICVNMAIAVPVGAWLGSRPDARGRQIAGSVVFVAQGMPGYIVGLLLIQLFAVELRWLPSIGSGSPAAWILPTLTLASFLAPKLIRVIAANVAEAMREDYIRTARAIGAGRAAVVWRHALPNALLGATALVGTQLAYLLSGAVVTEVIFAWPGLGRLLIGSVQVLDFPVIQASVFVIAAFVFTANAVTDVALQVIDPRLRRQRA